MRLLFVPFYVRTYVGGLTPCGIILVAMGGGCAPTLTDGESGLSGPAGSPAARAGGCASTRTGGTSGRAKEALLLLLPTYYVLLLLLLLLLLLVM